MEENGKKNIGEVIEWDDAKILELSKCANNIFEFIKHCKIVTDMPTNPNFTVDLRDYQIEMLKMILKYNYSVILSSRQSGKCQYFDTYLSVKNKTTGIIEKIKIGDLFERIKSQQK